MFRILVDVAMLWAITRVLAGQDVSDDLLRFVLFACVLVASSTGMVLGGVPPPFHFAAWIGLVLIGMKYGLGATWLGAAIGAVLFLAYRLRLMQAL